MIGAIAGDVIGSPYEGSGFKGLDFPLFSKYSRFTDDTVLTVAIAVAVLEERDYAESMIEIGRQHPLAGYGQAFRDWLFAPEIGPYNSWGNGSAMRVSPVGFAVQSEAEVLAEAKRSAQVTHNHPEGVKGAQAIALAVYLARTGTSKDFLRDILSERFGYDLTRTVEEIRPSYAFDLSCQGSVPESIVCFLDSTDFESAIRNAVSLGGDADTMACIAGAIAQAFYGEIPDRILAEVTQRLPEDFLAVVGRFNQRFDITLGARPVPGD